MEILPQIAKELTEIQVLCIYSMIGWGCSWVAYSKIELDFQNIDPFSKSFIDPPAHFHYKMRGLVFLKKWVSGVIL